MDISVDNATTLLLEDKRKPLIDEKPKKTATQKAVRKTFKLTAHLANLLPTGSVLAFQILAPVFTHEGKCRTHVSQTSTMILLGLCGISCFLLCFTDSFRDERGKVRYGMATISGLWVIDGTSAVPPEKSPEYRVKFIDIFHGLMSLAVFVAVAIFDKNVVSCFWPEPSEEAKELLSTLPVAVGVICSLLFVAFPTTRHGIGFPLTKI